MAEMEKNEAREDKKVKITDSEVIKWILACRDEADEAKRDRMQMNRENYDAFHLRYDFSHKEEGQSREVLAKQAMAVEQNKSFFQQSLADFGEWWKANAAYPDADLIMPIRSHEITKVCDHLLEEANYFSHVGNSIESAMLGALVISKLSGCRKKKPKFVARKKGRGKALKRWVDKIDDETWIPRFSVVRQDNYYPDPDGKGLYEIEDSWVDYHELLEMAEYDEDFDLAMIRSLPTGGTIDAEEQSGRARETGQNTTNSSHRRKVKLTEYWGTILDPSSGREAYCNIQAIVADDTHLILPPRPNPLWSQESPYTVSPLMEVANSVWHKAPMDAPTKYEHAMTEMYNLFVDAGIRQVHAVSQIRSDWLKDPAQVSDGIPPGAALDVNSFAPPGAKVLEPLTQVQIPPDAFNIYGIMEQGFNSSAMTNEFRANPGQSNASATAIVEASQTITSVFRGMSKNYEARQSQKELEKLWKLTAQNWDLIDKEIFVSLFGRQRGEELAQIPAEEIFAGTVAGTKFKVFGITMTLAKAQDFQKLTTLLQTIAASPVLMEEYVKKYDIGKTLGEIMTALNIDKQKLEIPQAVQNTMAPPQEGVPLAEPNQMSQVAPPQTDSLAQMMGSQQEQTGQQGFLGGSQQLGGMP